MKKTMFKQLSMGALALLGVCSLNAQTLVWDPDTNGTNDGGAGTWDVGTTANWLDGVVNVPWTNALNAQFGDAGAAYSVDVADGGVTVGDLTVDPGTGTVTFRSVTDNLGVLAIASGGATWNTGGRGIEILNDQINDTSLAMTGGDTLVITGGGTFNTGEKPDGADWAVGGATLDFQATTLRGNIAGVGAFSTVKMADGSTFVYQRNTPGETFTNDWQLSGAVTFDNNYDREFNLGGVVGDGASPGRLVVSDLGGLYLGLTNTGNTFSGGIVVDGSSTYTELQNYSGDGAFGAVPGSPVADSIRLKDGGALKLRGVTINANRGITLETLGVIILNNVPSSYAGKITGDGTLDIGLDTGGDANEILLEGDTSDYTGETHIHQGKIRLGINNALPTSTLLVIGGKGQSKLFMNGFSQEIVGLTTSGNNTRIVENSTTTDSTLTITVAEEETYIYNSNFDDRSGGSVSGNINIVKQGLGRQDFTKNNISALHGSITVTEGILDINNNPSLTGVEPSGISVTGDGSTLNLNALTVSGSLGVDSGGTLNLVIAGSTGSGLITDTATLGPDGIVRWNVDYGLLTAGNPSSAALTVNTTDGFDPSATNIAISISALGLAVGQFPIIQYAGTALADIDNFNLVGLPAGVTATLTNNTSSLTVDLVITDAVRLLSWYGDAGGDGTANWDVETSPNWDSGTAYYTNLYVTAGDAVAFTETFDFDSFNVNLTTTLTPDSVSVDNDSGGFAPEYIFSGSGKLSGIASLTKTGNGTLIITNTGGNDYTGGTWLKQGILMCGVADALPGAGVATLGFPNTGSTLFMNGFDQTIGGLISGGNTGPGNRSLQNGSATAATLTLNVTGTNDYTYTHSIGDQTQTNGIGNNFSMVKTGAGIQRIAKTFYDGTTLVSAGTLVYVPSPKVSWGTNTVSVSSSATLAGDGVIYGPVSVDAGGNLAPGAIGIGTLTVSNDVSLAGNTLVEITKDGGITNDQVSVSGTVNYGGILVVTNVGATALTGGDSFALFSASSHTGTFASIAPATPGAGLGWSMDYDTGVLSVISTAPPELTWANLGGGVIQFSFDTGNKLVWQTNTLSVGLSTNWVDYPDASNPVNVTNDPAIPAAFFGLQPE